MDIFSANKLLGWVGSKSCAQRPWPDIKPHRFLLLLIYYKGCDNIKSNCKQTKHTYKLEKIPVKDVVIHISLTVKQIAEKLTQIRVVWLVIKA